MTRKTICLDFDGVVHSYTSPWKDATHIPDPPVPGAFEWITAIMQHYYVAIYSSRSNQAGGIEAMRYWLEQWGMSPETVDSIQFPLTKPAAHVTIDDRAITFTGHWPSLREIQEFKPWNKK